MPTTETVTALSAAIVGPILAYLKVRDERGKTSIERDTQNALIEKRLTDCEAKITDLCEMKKSIERINVSLARIETILELYLKNNGN